MTAPATVQHILDRFLKPEALDGHRRRVCSHLRACHTPAMGGMQLVCDQCDSEQHWYHGCRDRHCPQCQSRATRRWAQRRQDDLIPVRYFHVVFTLPHHLNGWVQLHPELIYRLLFKAVWTTLKTFGQDPKRLNGQVGMTAVLHTWGQNLSQHVHLHCLIPGGALGSNGQWHPARSNYLFPVRALSRHFRGQMVSLLRQAATRGELSRVTRSGEVDDLLDRLMAIEWVVYSKHCLDHTASVVGYLARYTHRIAISNARILQVDDREVVFRYTDYRNSNATKTMRLTGQEFVRRFLMHILPKGLMRVRHFGFLANCCRGRQLARIRQALSDPKDDPAEPSRPSRPETWPCPTCNSGRLHRVRAISPTRTQPHAPG